MKLPNAVLLGDKAVFVLDRDADKIAEAIGGRAASLPPSEYERFVMRRLFWRELGLRYDEMPHGDVQEAVEFIRLEHEHNKKQQPKRDN